MRPIRVIARLDVKGPNVVKGVQFEALRVLGKPADFAKKYFEQGADELIYIDIVASLYRRENLLQIVRNASKSVFIPFTAGGGVRSIEDIHDLLQAGAEKVAINTAATKRPEFIREAAQRFGSQCVVLSIEAKRVGESWEAYTDNGRQATGLDVIEWAKKGEELGAGEILLTSVDNDGMQRGLDGELIEAVSRAVKIPVIASGGAESSEEIAQVISKTEAQAVAVASALHYGHTTIAHIKDALQKAGCATREPTEREKQITVESEEADFENYNRYTLRQRAQESTGQSEASETEHLSIVSPEAADVVIVDYGINNVRSVAMAFDSLGKKIAFAKTADEIKHAKRLVLPGVGAFRDGMRALTKNGLHEAIKKYIEADLPFFGICLGMQLLFSSSEEFGSHAGLGIIEGDVVSFPDPATVNSPDYKLPHIGWNTISPPRQNPTSWERTPLMATKRGESMYFVHSFYPVPKDPNVVLATSLYGGVEFCAAISYRNATATQFHTEKSGAAGLKLLSKFCEAEGA